jgi:DNA-binding MarR family transcriptional regulator
VARLLGPDCGPYNAQLNAVTPSSVGLSDFLHAAGTLESFLESKLSAAGLSLPKLAALSRLAESGDSLPLGQLAERLACVKSNVTQLVDRLEADGFVSRAQDPNDGRSRLAVLTEAGRAAHERGVAIRGEAEQQVLSALSKEEADRLGELVEKLRRASG